MAHLGLRLGNCVFHNGWSRTTFVRTLRGRQDFFTVFLNRPSRDILRPERFNFDSDLEVQDCADTMLDNVSKIDSKPNTLFMLEVIVIPTNFVIIFYKSKYKAACQLIK